jgi:hypothetical protein
VDGRQTWGVCFVEQLFAAPASKNRTGTQRRSTLVNQTIDINPEEALRPLGQDAMALFGDPSENLDSLYAKFNAEDDEEEEEDEDDDLDEDDEEDEDDEFEDDEDEDLDDEDEDEDEYEDDEEEEDEDEEEDEE